MGVGCDVGRAKGAGKVPHSSQTWDSARSPELTLSPRLLTRVCSLVSHQIRNDTGVDISQVFPCFPFAKMCFH